MCEVMRAVALKTDLTVDRKNLCSAVCKSVFLSPFCHFKDQNEIRKQKKMSSALSLFSVFKNRGSSVSSDTCVALAWLSC